MQLGRKDDSGKSLETAFARKDGNSILLFSEEAEVSPGYPGPRKASPSIVHSVADRRSPACPVTISIATSIHGDLETP